jgi:hypothetical protein
MAVKCEKCDREFKEEEAREYPGKVRVYHGKVMCEDCLLDMGVTVDESQPYWEYVKTRTDLWLGS